MARDKKIVFIVFHLRTEECQLRNRILVIAIVPVLHSSKTKGSVSQNIRVLSSEDLIVLSFIA